MAEEEEYQGEEIDKDRVIEELSEIARESQHKNTQLLNNISSMSNSPGEGNLAQYQIDNSELLEKLEHFYKGEYLSYEGEEASWVKPKDKEMIPLNSFGVSALMEIVSKYIDRNTVLSYYKEERIYEILADLGDDLVMFILSNYEKMGLDTSFKKTKFRLIVITTLHMIESSYRRAIGGETMKEINQSRIITQSDILRPQIQPQNPKRGFFSSKLRGF